MCVHRGVLLDVGVRRGDVGFGLVVVVVGDEVLDGVAGEELPELAVELRGQGLVGGEHQGRSLDLLDDLGDGEGLARTGHSQQRLVGETGVQTVDQLGNGRRLIARRAVVGDNLEVRHGLHGSLPRLKGAETPSGGRAAWHFPWRARRTACLPPGTSWAVPTGARPARHVPRPRHPSPCRASAVSWNPCCGDRERQAASSPASPARCRAHRGRAGPGP